METITSWKWKKKRPFFRFCRLITLEESNLRKVCIKLCQIERDNEISRLSFDIVKDIDIAGLNAYGYGEILNQCKQLCDKLHDVLDHFADVDRVRNLCNVAEEFALVVRDIEQKRFHSSKLSSRVCLSFAVQRAKERLKFYDQLQVPSGKTSYLLSRLRDTCDSICSCNGEMSLPKKEIEILVLDLLQLPHAQDESNVHDIHDEASTDVTNFYRKCEKLCQVLNIIYENDGRYRNDATVLKTFSLIKDFVERFSLPTRVLNRLRNACHQMCSMEGEIGVLASDLLHCSQNPYSYDTHDVLKRCWEMCHKYSILLNSFERTSKAREIIHIGYEFIAAVIALIKISTFKFKIEQCIIDVLNDLKVAKEKLIRLQEVRVSLFKILLAFLLEIPTQIVFLDDTKHGTSLKVTRLVLYNCGDIERNPGPVPRDFRKSQQTPLLHMIYGKLDKEPPPPNSLYTEGPPFFWNQYPGVTDAAFFNIPNVAKHNKEKGTHYKEEDCKKCFQRIIDILRIVMREDMPDDLAKVLRCYEDLMRIKKGRKENKEYYEQCEKEVEIWLSKKQRAKTQKDLNASNSDLEVCLEHKLESLKTGGGSLSAKEHELMQKIMNFGQSQNQTKTTGQRKRRQEEKDLIDDNNTRPSDPKCSRQDSDLTSFDDESFPDVLDLLDSDSSPGSSFCKETRDAIHGYLTGTPSPSPGEHNQIKQAFEKFVYQLCKDGDLID